MAQLPDRPGPQLIVKMLNDANNTTFTIDDFSFGVPQPSVRQGYDTQIDLTFVGAVYGGQVKRFFYNRLDLALLIGMSNTSFVDNGAFTDTNGALSQINTRRNLHLSLQDVQDETFQAGPYPNTLTLNARNDSLVLLPGGLVQIVVTQPDPADPSALALDFTYVDQLDPTFTAFIAFVDNAVTNGPDSSISALDAAYAYRITNEEQYRLLAISIVDQEVSEAEAQIALGLVPAIAGDSYLHVGPNISALATTYAWCNPDNAQRARWAAYADRAIGNVWDHPNAYWGVTPAPWTGWSVNDPGNNYYYSFCIATATWGLASNNSELLTFLETSKLGPLNTFYTGMIGGGTREGTGYGVALMNLFDLYMFWRDSGQPDIANSNEHLGGTIYYWVHATMPTLDKYCPIGDLSRESYPWLFDYHRSLMLKARQLTIDPVAKDVASWWLNNISKQTMQQGWQRKYNILPAGNYNLPPEQLSYRAVGAGCLFARTSWDTNAVFMHFLAGTYDQSHAHQAQGSFVFFRNDFLAVTPNIFCLSGIQQNVTGQNVLRFNRADTSVIPQSYGEAVMSSTINGVNGNASAQATLGDIIADTSVDSWGRNISFTNGVLGIKDTFQTNSGTTATFQVCVNSLNPPTFDGNEIIAGDLEILVFDPANPIVDIVDMSTVSPDYQSGYRVDISGGTGFYDVELRSIGHSGSGSGNAGRPRFSVQPQTQTVVTGGTATFNATAIQPGSSTTLAVLNYVWEIKTGGTWDETGDYGQTTSVTNLSSGAAGWKIRCKAVNENGVTYSREVGIVISP